MTRHPTISTPRPPVNKPHLLYNYYLQTLPEAFTKGHFNLGMPYRARLEHFLDKEQREHGFAPRESEYYIAKRLREYGTAHIAEPKQSKWSYAHEQLLWLYNLHAALELNPKLAPLVAHDLETWKCQSHNSV